MRIAVISDIHGNLPALQEAIADACQKGADLLLGAGDWVGYGPFPDKVIEYLTDLAIPCVSGNYDVKTIHAGRHPERFAARMKPFKWDILKWTCDQLSSYHYDWLESLPELLDMEPVPGCRLLVCHGIPGDNEGRIYPDITSDKLAAITNDQPPRTLVAGHTHIPFVKTVNGCLVINAGSAGQPVDGDYRPAYCLIDFKTGQEPDAQIVRFDYPISILLNAIGRTRLPAGLREDYSRGIKRK